MKADSLQHTVDEDMCNASETGTTLQLHNTGSSRISGH